MTIERKAGGTPSRRGRKALGLSLAALAALGLGAAWVYREQIGWYVQLARTYLAARRFYNTYEPLARDVAFQPDMQPRLDVYSPPAGVGYPVLFFVHGGSWKDFHKELFAPVAMKLVPEGMVVVIPDYTLYPNAGYEQMADEVAAALSWTLENIDTYGGDPARVVVAGHSAGAHLAGLAVMDPRFLAAYGHSSAEIRGLIGMSGVYDVQAEYDYWVEQGAYPEVIVEVMGGEERFAPASPIEYVRPDLPPVLLIHGDRDETVPVSIATAFHAALLSVGADSELEVYDGRGHADYLFAALAQDGSRLVTDIAAFVRRSACQNRHCERAASASEAIPGQVP
ncbi:MAG: alpha/beta hydrolase [Anaerolineae bacterium]